MTRRGGVVIETALVAALLAVLAIVAADAAMAWRIRTALVTAAREGARIASLVPNLRPNDPSTVAVMDQILIGEGIQLARAQRSVTFSSPLTVGEPVTAMVTYSYQPSAPGLMAAFSGPIPLQADARMPYRGSGVISSAPQPPVNPS